MDMKSEPFEGGVKLELSGEFDIGGVPKVEGAIRRLEEERPALLILDLSGLTFIDSSGLRVILTADRRAKEQSRRFALVQGPSAVQRIFKITGIDTVLEFVAQDQAS